MTRWLGPYAEWIYGATRFVTGMMFWMHGTQKLFGWPLASRRPLVELADLLSLTGMAGIIEVVAGFMIMVGFRASSAAFIASGEMATAYFLRQMPFAILPIFQPPGNLGESAVFNCFFFLYVAAKGSGPFSVDALLRPGPAPAKETV